MKKDFQCESYVDVTVRSKTSKSVRTTPTACHVTPKRIYTIGGTVFDRASGRQIARLSDRVWGDYVRTADPATIRMTKAAA